MLTLRICWWELIRQNYGLKQYSNRPPLFYSQIQVSQHLSCTWCRRVSSHKVISQKCHCHHCFYNLWMYFSFNSIIAKIVCNYLFNHNSHIIFKHCGSRKGKITNMLKFRSSINVSLYINWDTCVSHKITMYKTLNSFFEKCVD